MNVNAISVSNQYTPAPIRKADNDGDYDKGTGQDDTVQQKSLQAAAQPHLGATINIQA